MYCIKPEHLYLGTAAENMSDMRKRNKSWIAFHRARRGTHHNYGWKISLAMKGKPKTKKHIKAAAIARKAVGNGPWSEKQWQAHLARGIKIRMAKHGSL